MSSLNTVNQYANITRRVCSAVAYWTPILGDMGSKYLQAFFLQPPFCYFTLLREFLYFPNNYNLTPLYGPTASGAIVKSTSQFPSPAMLVSLTAGIRKYGSRIYPNGITSIPNFIQIRPSLLELNIADRQTDRHKPYMRPFDPHRKKSAKRSKHSGTRHITFNNSVRTSKKTRHFHNKDQLFNVV
jgi:hypothetical protein